MIRIFRVGHLWSGDSEIGTLEDAFLLIDKDKIAGVGSWNDRPRKKSFKLIEHKKHIAMPGMINLHGHLAMTLFRGLGETADLHSWLFDYIFPAEKKKVSAAFVKEGTTLALRESLRAGVTFVTDMYFYSEVVAKLIEDFGMRGIVGRSYFEQGAYDSKDLEDSFEKSKSFIKKTKRMKRVMGVLAPHAPYTCSVETLKRTARLAQELDCGIMIHTAETKKELADIKRQTGLSPVALLDQTGILKAKFALLAHCVWLEDSDFKILARPNVSSVLNAKSNAKLASGFPPISKMKASKVRWVLGTDGPASNNTLDLFSEMDFIARTNRLITGSLTDLTPQDIIEAVTIRSAEAIGMGGKIGSLTPGKQADFILIDGSGYHMQPISDLSASLVFSGRAADVTHVFVDGRCLMESRRLKISQKY